MFVLLSVWAWTSKTRYLVYPDGIRKSHPYMPHTEDAPGWDVYLHPPGIFGQWRMLEGCGVADGAASWERSIDFRRYRWYLGLGRARLELGDGSAASSCVQLRIAFRFSYGHAPSFHTTDLCVMMMLNRIISGFLYWRCPDIYCYNIWTYINI